MESQTLYSNPIKQLLSCLLLYKGYLIEKLNRFNVQSSMKGLLKIILQSYGYNNDD